MTNEILFNNLDVPIARKVASDNAEKEIIIPDKVGARNLNLPTFTVKVPDQTLEEVMHLSGGFIRRPQNVIPNYEISKKSKDVEDIRAEFNFSNSDSSKLKLIRFALA